MEDGPLTEATEIRPPQGEQRSRTWSAGSGTDTMPPRPDRPPAMASARSDTTFAASSRERAPETVAAAISPWLWPMTAAGRTPTDCQSAARETMTAQSADCTATTSSRDGTCSSSGPPPCSSPRVSPRSSPRITSVTDQPTWGLRAASHSASRSANTVEDSRSSAAIPRHCEPCPGKTNATRPGSSGAVPVTVPAAGRPSARAARPARALARSDARTTARCSNAARVAAREWPTSAAARSVRASTQAESRSAWARRAASDRPDTGQGTTPGVTPGVTTGTTSGTVPGAGAVPPVAPASAPSDRASSTMMWALVPLMPKEEIPARRGRPSASHSTASVSSSTAPALQSTCGDGRSTWRVRGSTPCRMACTIFMTPATPAAACACPMLDLTDPSRNGRSAGRSWP